VEGAAKKGHEPGRWLAVAAGLLVPALALILYVGTLAPTVLQYDSGTLQAKAYVLGIGHPTGYPTFILLGHLFTYLPFGDPAYRVNLSSATYAALSALLVYLAALRLVPGRRTLGGILAAATGALAFAFGPTLWSQAAITEVYTLNALFLAVTVYLLLLWRDGGRERHLLLAALFGGLAVTAHATSGLLLPSALAFVLLARPRTLRRPALLAKVVGAGLLGLLPYLYLPIRASMDPPMNYGEADTLRGFFFLLSGGNFRGQMFQFGPAELPERVDLYLDLLTDQFPLPLLLAAAVGLVVVLLRDRAALALLGVLALGTVAYALEYDIPDLAAYFIPSYLVAALLLSVGLGYVATAVGGLAERLAGGSAPELAPLAAAVVLAPALLALALAVPGVRAEVDQSGNLDSRRLVEQTVRETERGATVVAGRDIAALQYMQSVERRRRDLRLSNANDAQLLDRTRAALARGTCYVVTRSPTQKRELREAGYDLEPVGEGLYRVER